MRFCFVTSCFILKCEFLVSGHLPFPLVSTAMCSLIIWSVPHYLHVSIYSLHLLLSWRHFSPLDISKTVNIVFVCFPFLLEWDLLGRVAAIVNLFLLLPFLFPSEGEIIMWRKFSKCKGLFFITFYLPSFYECFFLVSSYSFGFFLQQEWLLVLKAVFVFTVPKAIGLIK